MKKSLFLLMAMVAGFYGHTKAPVHQSATVATVNTDAYVFVYNNTNRQFGFTFYKTNELGEFTDEVYSGGSGGGYITIPSGNYHVAVTSIDYFVNSVSMQLANQNYTFYANTDHSIPRFFYNVDISNSISIYLN